MQASTTNEDILILEVFQDITGVICSLDGAEAVLHHRLFDVSDDGNDYWRFCLQPEYQRNHLARSRTDIPLMQRK
ncbi:MAG: hypothetical protein RMX68_010025 [Aulosira sp. ZfuVER01]|nr:hypothetical protein [Aulosira sp. ZfuVER01]MDZ7998055.1 hypothetical protein [Aulosira sp. DedVER01a]MDZ8050449.1 hypothetical protein [Aulosira sp. ZfuCHP01]